MVEQPELPRRLTDLAAWAAQYQNLPGEESDWPSDQEILGYRLVCTCVACPEQYDVFDAAGAKVGYLRLRHGIFRADVPDVFGETVYSSRPHGDGTFRPEEREIELQNAIAAIHKKVTT